MERTVVNKHHNVPYDVYIGRGSKWGNPYSHLPSAKAEYKVATRDEAIAAYREWIMHQPLLIEALPEIKGKIKCCYCFPAPCHGDVLEELAQILPDLTDVTEMTQCSGYTVGATGYAICDNPLCPRKLYCYWSAHMIEEVSDVKSKI